MATKELQWVTIDDFSPGIYSSPGNERDSFATPTHYFASAASAPLGSAVTTTTWGCLPNSNGKGLIPGFYSAYDNNIGFTVAKLADANAASPYIISGFDIANFGGMVSAPVMGILYKAATTNKMTLKLLREVILGAQALFRTITSGNTNTQYAGMTFAFSRMATAAPYTLAGQPVFAYGYGANYNTMGEAGVHPDPTAANVDGVAAFTDKGNVLSHQNRVVLLVSDGGSFYNFGSAVASGTGERIDFTDPANSNVMGTQREVFYPEQMTGYGAWGSLSASALLLIKRFGGAVLLEGDIKGPRASILPGVQSTGNLMSRAAVTPIGLVYASDGAGVWAWQGGSTSVKISRQLDDWFYRDEQVNTHTYFDTAIVPGEGPSFQAMHYNDYIFMSGGWIYHIPTGSWWRLDDPTNGGRQYLWFGVNLNEQASVSASPTLYAIHPAAILISGTTYRTGYRYSLGKYASRWQWQSQPLPAPVKANEEASLLEVVVICERDLSNEGTTTITVSLFTAGVITEVLPSQTVTAAGQRQALRFNCNRSASNISVMIYAQNSTDGKPAPMVHELRLGFDKFNLMPSIS